MTGKEEHSKERILDVGCLKNFTRGTDYIDLYPTRNDVIRCDADNDRFPYPDKTFDRVVSYYLFEHLTNHANYMQESHRVLKEGGTLIIHTDSAAYVGATILHDHGDGDLPGRDDHHFALFTPKHLENYARKFGFKTLRTEYVDEDEGEPTNIAKKLLKKTLAMIDRRLVTKCVRLTAIKKPMNDVKKDTHEKIEFANLVERKAAAITALGILKNHVKPEVYESAIAEINRKYKTEGNAPAFKEIKSYEPQG